AAGPGRVIGVFLAVLGFAVFLLVYVFPLYWLVVTSLKGKAELYAAEIPLFPLNPTLEAYADVLVARSFGVLLRNSIIVCLATVATTLALGLLITYPLTRLDIPRGVRVGVLTWALSLRFLQPIAVVVPYFAIVRTAGLYDNPLA